MTTPRYLRLGGRIWGFAPWLAIVSLLYVLAASLSQAATPFLPIGIYGVPKTSDFAEIRDAGFNIVAGPGEKDYLEAAKAAGLKVLATVPAQKNSSLQRMKQPLRFLDRHAALWGWYLVDEPDLNLVSPTDVQEGYRAMKRIGLRKPIALTLFQGYEAGNYAEFCDILMVDRYPVPWLPLANFGQHMHEARLAVGKQKPFVAIIQAFDWAAYPGLLRTKAALRPPTYSELRCMAYEALARGANGMFFYEFDGTWKIREHPEVWSALKQVVREVSDRASLFQAEPAWWAKDHDYQDSDTAFNEALESSVTSTLLTVTKSDDRIPAGQYILAVNNTSKPLNYSFLLPSPKTAPNQPASSTGVVVFGESREIETLRNRVNDRFEPYAVHVYGPLKR